MSISTNVDDVAEFTIGVVEGVANLLLMSFSCEAAPHVPLLVANPLDLTFVTLHMDGDCDIGRRWRKICVGVLNWSWDHLIIGEEFIVVT